VDRIALEMALRDAGVGGDLSIALAAELAHAWAEADGIADALASAFRRPLQDALGLPDPDAETERCLPALAADADTAGDLGELRGRRVA
jgi:hypothetical protein